MTIRAFESWGSVPGGDELCALVEAIQLAPPYAYAEGELPPAATWFPDLLRSGGILHVAYDEPDRPAGYVLTLPLHRHRAGARFGAVLGLDPARAVYVAELGVADRARRTGLGTRLLARAHAEAPWPATAYVVRTLAGNEPALGLYHRAGYRLVDGVEEIHRDRRRVFLVRDTGAEESVPA